jgi:glycosyltransferase involved in cell wall biosynthesis
MPRRTPRTNEKPQNASNLWYKCSKNGSMELSIVMPCLNEAETLEICISKARIFLERSGISGEIVIGDNGSADGSPEIASRCGARVVNVSVRGYGAALYGAIMATQGKYCVVGDSDDSCDFTRLGHFVEKLRAGADLVVGNRFLGGSRPAPCRGKIVT